MVLFDIRVCGEAFATTVEYSNFRRETQFIVLLRLN